MTLLEPEYFLKNLVFLLATQSCTVTARCYSTVNLYITVQLATTDKSAITNLRLTPLTLL